MIKPSNLWCDNLSIFVASSHSFKVAVSSLSLCCNLFPVTSNALVFSVLMYILFSVDHFSISSKSLERARVKEVILFQSALKGGWYRQHIYQWWSCSNVKAYHSQIGEIKLERGLIPAVPLAWQLSGQMLYALVSQIAVTLPDMIKTRPCYLGWHRTLIIISLVVVCAWLRWMLYGNQQILVPWLHHYPF